MIFPKKLKASAGEFLRLFVFNIGSHSEKDLARSQLIVILGRRKDILELLEKHKKLLQPDMRINFSDTLYELDLEGHKLAAQKTLTVAEVTAYGREIECLYADVECASNSARIHGLRGRDSQMTLEQLRMLRPDNSSIDDFRLAWLVGSFESTTPEGKSRAP